MPDQVNKEYETQLEQHIRAFRNPKSAEYKKRKTYPGEIDQCLTPDCLNSAVEGGCITYWLCEDCHKKAPDIIEFHTHVPPQKVASDRKARETKRRRNNGAALAGWLQGQKRLAKEVGRSDVPVSAE
jgi:hypothetical protein